MMLFWQRVFSSIIFNKMDSKGLTEVDKTNTVAMINTTKQIKLTDN